ncbi:MAG: histidine kinase [Chloroflexi bacterium]|nr:MAG: histidine kinase [Chloroflexota bacterium]
MTPDETRPRPDALLEAITETTQQDGRGSLLVFLGAAPGVGKTWAMLAEGHRLKNAGIDVVCGFVETHGRAETAGQIGDLEVVPRMRVDYRGVSVEEMDTDAILARRPHTCLVDELAHTNVPGSPREKRWQDVEVLRDAGINVISTLNVQHLESLNDVVEAITGIQVRETVPDAILDAPTRVQLIDLHPDVLRERLREGKIYSPALAQQALERYFRAGNLTALRELALRRTAEGVETALERYMAVHDIAGPWAATETVLACFDGRSLSSQVLRHAWRLAHGLDASFIALHVLRQPLETLPLEERWRIERNTQLAEDLGAETVLVVAPDIVGAVLAQARERNVTHLVVGHSTRSRWQELRGRSLVTALIHAARGYDILVVADRAQERG